MQAQTIFYLLTGFIIVEFLIEKYLDWLNAKHFNDALPKAVADVYDRESYKKSQQYKTAHYKFEQWTGFISLLAILLILWFHGFAYLDSWVSKFTNSAFLQSLYFFGIIIVISSFFSMPFAYYKTFVIEEKFGFNQSNRKLFFTDQIKSLLLSLVLGGILLSAFIWFFQKTGANFWLYAWGIFALFSIFINMFYTDLIVPLFNKLTPLPDGELKDKLKELAQKTDYRLSEIYVMDGSKRSSKANAYFSGIGPKKKVVLYDTLINDLTPAEITAVLAHEIGHYKRKHIIFQLILSLLVTGLMLFLLSLVIHNDLLAQALGVPEAKFHINIIAFALLFTPLSFLLGLLTNYISRQFEYQADAFAKKYHNAGDLIGGLKKLSRKSLSNLTPHPWYVWAHYSHPTLLQRIKTLKK